jgi:hypothetical protein
MLLEYFESPYKIFGKNISIKISFDSERLHNFAHPIRTIIEKDQCIVIYKPIKRLCQQWRNLSVI